MKAIEKEIWDTIQAMNQCWTSGDRTRLDKLNDYFHSTMVAITATDQKRLEGKSACLGAWKSFAQNALIKFWKESEPLIQTYGNAAVVTYYFDMTFEMGGQTITMGGRDMLTLIKEDGKWWIVADQFSSYPQR
ncbi:MAG: nuclear transport factor 2 family protein [Proteobacteria bacterium]|nr:nuclear transport factor 2 family protein [Desulfobulbaceae bacterium]MBU4152287.1 nuclear transport factor 2 family protein [Pseudomonadota bacterium]